MDSEQSALEENFRFLLLHVGTKLNASNRRGLAFVYNIQERRTEHEPGTYMLEEMLGKGMFDCRSPDKLQEMLIKIGRKDLSHHVKEYKKSSLFKQHIKKNDMEKETTDVVLALDIPEGKRRTTFATAYRVASQLGDHVTTLKETLEKVMSEEEEITKSGKFVAAISEAQERIDKCNTFLKKALEMKQEPGTAETVLQVTPKNSKKKKPLQLPRFHKKRTNSSNKSIVYKSSNPSTPPVPPNKPPRTKFITMTPDTGRLKPQAHSRDHDSDEDNCSDLGSLSQRHGVQLATTHRALAKELSEGMKAWERRVSQTSQCTTTEDSGYADYTWDTTLPAQTDQGVQPKNTQKEDAWYVNIDNFSHDDHSQDGNYEKLTEATRNSQHEYLVYGNREGAMGTVQSRQHTSNT